MNKFKIMALSLFVGVLGTSCADMLDDNVSSDKSKGITAETGLPTIVYYAAQTNYDHAEYYIYLRSASQLQANRLQVHMAKKAGGDS